MKKFFEKQLNATVISIVKDWISWLINLIPILSLNWPRVQLFNYLVLFLIMVDFVLNVISTIHRRTKKRPKKHGNQ